MDLLKKIKQRFFLNFVRLWNHFHPRRQKQFILILLLMVIISAIEVISLGSIIPFLSVLTNPDNIFKNRLLSPFFLNLGIVHSNQLIFPIVLGFAFFSMLSCAARILLLWVNTRFSILAGSDISLDIYRKTLYQPYQIHLSRNSSEIVSGIVSKSNTIIGQVVLPTLVMIGSMFLLFAILISAIVVSPFIALVSFFVIGILYVFIAWDAKKRLAHNGEILANEHTIVIKSLQEGLGGIRDVLLNGSQEAYCEIYRKSDFSLRKAAGNIQIIASSPRYSLEALAMVVFAFFSYYVSITAGGLADQLPLLGGLALAALRMLPILQQAYQAWANIKSGELMLLDVLGLLDQKLPDHAIQQNFKPIPFRKEINLVNISFRYSEDRPYVIRNTTLTIKNGSRIGFIGRTGSGKSTLLDIVMGLLEPTIGLIKVDDLVLSQENMKAWQLNIANVPQSIYLSDSSICENIAFGIHKDKIEMEKVFNSAKQAQIYDFVSNLEDGFATLVGERGVRLSGGQRQRIGIARALYKEARLIIFDEATSSLDTETEQAVMESIDGLGRDLTILIIAHRLSTVRKCEKIFKMSNGELSQVDRDFEILSGN